MRCCPLLLAVVACVSVVDATQAAPAGPPITRIKAIRALTPDEGAEGHRVRIRGVVAHFDVIGHGLLFVHDGKAGQFVEAPQGGEPTGWRSLRVGELIEIEGHTVRGGFAPNVVAERIRKLGRGALPQPKQLPYGQLLTGRHDCDYVEIEGIVQRAFIFNHLLKYCGRRHSSQGASSPRDDACCAK